jgi:DedD protein
MAAEQLNEQEIQFKKRARRRLVGAIALVLLMVTVLPMLLDDRTVKTPEQEITVTIPSQENKDFTSKVVPLTPETQQQASEREAVPEAIDESAATTSPADTQPVTEATEKATDAAKTPQPKPAAKPAVEKPVTQASAEPYAVQIGVFSTMASIKQLQLKLSAQGYKSYTEKLTTDSGEKMRLRAGPFASRAEAEKAAAKIKDAGMAGMVVAK